MNSMNCSDLSPPVGPWEEALQLVRGCKWYFVGCTLDGRQSSGIFMGNEAIGWTRKIELGGSRQRLTGALFFYSECGRRVSFISFSSNDIYWFGVLDVTITELVRSGCCADGSLIISWVSQLQLSHPSVDFSIKIHENKGVRVIVTSHTHTYTGKHTVTLLILGPDKWCRRRPSYITLNIFMSYIYIYIS